MLGKSLQVTERILLPFQRYLQITTMEGGNIPPPALTGLMLSLACKPSVYDTIIYTLKDIERCKPLSLKPDTISWISRKK